jgi:hypothetical protein
VSRADLSGYSRRGLSEELVRYGDTPVIDLRDM